MLKTIDTASIWPYICRAINKKAFLVLKKKHSDVCKV